MLLLHHAPERDGSERWSGVRESHPYLRCEGPPAWLLAERPEDWSPAEDLHPEQLFRRQR